MKTLPYVCTHIPFIQLENDSGHLRQVFYIFYILLSKIDTKLEKKKDDH